MAGSAALLAALLTPVQASGQPPATAAAPPARVAAPARASLAELQTGATCVLARTPNAADPLLAAAPFSADERALAARLLAQIQACLRRPPLAAPIALLRGALAETVLEARFPAQPPARTPPLGVAHLLRPDLASTRPDAARLAPVYALAGCTAVRQPQLVRAFLATQPGTAPAGTAFSALGPTLNACVPAGAGRITVNPPVLRGLLAEQLYRWSVVQRDGPASPWAAPAVAAAPATPQAH